MPPSINAATHDGVTPVTGPLCPTEQLRPTEQRYGQAFRSGTALYWRQAFPGSDHRVRELRRWLTRLLPDCAPRTDVVTVAVEFATNAIRHTASGRANGFFVAEVTWYGPLVRVAIADGGGASEPRILEVPYSDDPDGFDEHGRGLRIVDALSVRTGVIGDTRGRVVWAELLWTAEQATPPPAADGHSGERHGADRPGADGHGADGPGREKAIVTVERA